MGRIGGGGGAISGGGGSVSGGDEIGSEATTFLEHVAMVFNHAVCSADLSFQSAALELIRMDDRTGKPKDKG